MNVFAQCAVYVVQLLLLALKGQIVELVEGEKWGKGPNCRVSGWCEMGKPGLVVELVGGVKWGNRAQL